MTKKAFQYDMQRGLGSCVVALKNMQEAEREKFFPLVLRGCSCDMAYDAQCEGCRSVYLYDLIAQFPDVTPFIDVLEKRLFQCMRSAGWEFHQDCELLAYFVSDRVKRAWRILMSCYDKLYQILLNKRKADPYGRLPERDNFERLCLSLVGLCFDDRRRKTMLYEKIVKDLGILIERNALYAVDDFSWFQQDSVDELGEKSVHRSLNRANADEYTKKYARLLEEYERKGESECRKQRRVEPETADEIYERLKNGEKLTQVCSSLRVHGFMIKNKEQEALKIAAYYKYEETEEVRYGLLRLLANQACAWTVDLTRLIADTKSEHPELSTWAFEALSYRTDAGVRAYALDLLQKGTHIAEAASLLAANYEACDEDIFVNAVKQIPITYKTGVWHGTFNDVMDLFERPGKNKPRELLPYMYHNTLCSFCREYVVREMGRRRMLTRELLEEMQYDCNTDIRAYANKKLRRK